MKWWSSCLSSSPKFWLSVVLSLVDLTRLSTFPEHVRQLSSSWYDSYWHPSRILSTLSLLQIESFWLETRGLPDFHPFFQGQKIFIDKKKVVLDSGQSKYLDGGCIRRIGYMIFKFSASFAFFVQCSPNFGQFFSMDANFFGLQLDQRPWISKSDTFLKDIF